MTKSKCKSSGNNSDKENDPDRCHWSLAARLMMPLLWTRSESRSFLVFRQKMDGNLKPGLLLPMLWRRQYRKVVRRLPRNVRIIGRMYASFFQQNTDPHVIPSPQLKKNYVQVNKLRNQSGFGWDDGLKMVTASDDVWATYLKVRSIYFATHASENSYW